MITKICFVLMFLSTDGLTVQSTGKESQAIIKERACEHTDLKLKCGEGTLIAILSANYGRHSLSFCPSNRILTSNCSAQSSMDKVKEACNNQQRCAVNASNDVFGDPCLGTFKYLEVEYYCKDFQAIMKARACEHTDLKLKCGEGTVIAIVSANYGRHSLSFCPSNRILTSNCSAQSSMDKVKEACNNQQRCAVNASNDVFGDPCKGTFKYLEVGYYCKATMKARACEHTDLKLKCGEGKVIAILSANYGRHSLSFCPSNRILTSNCSAQSSMDKVKEACNNQQKCAVNASNTVFGDPCKGTFKYLEVGYYCKVSECNKACGLNSHCFNEKCVCNSGCQGYPEKGCRCRCSKGRHICAYGAYCENNHCKCYPGLFGDGKKYCDEMCVCRVHGDPHIKTFDYQMINFQGICKYTLAKLSVASDDCSFDVEIKNEHRGRNKRVSYVRLVDFTIYGVSIRLHKKDVKVNGKMISHAKNDIAFLGGKIVLRRKTNVEVVTQCGISVSFDESHAKVVVKVPRKYQNQLTGICGNCDGIANDLRTKNGKKVKDSGAIVHSYLVNDDSDKANPKCKKGAKPSVGIN